jgi:hypothetical protein
LSPGFSSICGYTDADVDTVFAPELEGLDREEIRHWYNGYHWRGEAVYNPFDLLLLFREREFRPFWLETGTPTFLVDMLTERKVYLPALLEMESSSELISAFEVGDISTEALMFQISLNSKWWRVKPKVGRYSGSRINGMPINTARSINPFT